MTRTRATIEAEAATLKAELRQEYMCGTLRTQGIVERKIQALRNEWRNASA